MKNFLAGLAASVALALAFACGGDSAEPVQYNVPVRGVAIDGKVPRLMVGDKLSLEAQIMPARATNNQVAWASSDPQVAAVTGDGVRASVIAEKAGEASITVTSVEGGFTDTFRMIVGDGSVPAAGVALDRAAVSLVSGGSVLLTATLWPDDATDQAMAWDSSNKSAVTVVGNGPTAMVTAVANGTSAVTVKTADGGYTATCNVTVAPYTPPITDLTLNNSYLEVLRNATGTLTATVMPSNVAVVPAWSSSNTGVATVSANATGLTGTITPVAPGNTTITVAAGGKSALCSVTVRMIPVSAIALDKTTMEVLIRTTGSLTATLTPTNATERGISWMSSNPGVATVSGASTAATVTGVAAGTATIRALSENGLAATCAVTVTSVPLTGVTLDKASMSLLPRGGAAYLTAVPVPANSTDTIDSYEWTSSAPGVSGVSGAGAAATITPVAPGNTNITVKINGSDSLTATCAVTVLNSTAIAMVVPQPFKLGYTDSFGIKTDGTLWGWGQNNYGKLGDGTSALKNVPTKINDVTTWKHIAAGYNHTMAIRTDGSLWAWGYNDSGKLGIGEPSGERTTPVRVVVESWEDNNCWATVAVGDNQTVAIKTDGTLWAWGRNTYGQLGQGTSGDARQTTPIQVGTDTHWVAAATGVDHLLALKDDGTLWAWGRNNNQCLGQGQGNITQQNSPVRVGTDSNWKAIAVGDNHCMALKTDGTLYTWGSGSDGRLGQGNNTTLGVPTRVLTATDTWKTMAGGGTHSIAIKTDGTVWCWGAGSYGQIGDNATSSRNTPTKVTTDYTDWVACSAGQHSGALRANGSVWCWGYNSAGQIGDGTDGTSNNRRLPVQAGTGFRLPN